MRFRYLTLASTKAFSLRLHRSARASQDIVFRPMLGRQNYFYLTTPSAVKDMILRNMKKTGMRPDVKK